MKAQTIVSTLVFAAVLMLSLSTYAADLDQPKTPATVNTSATAATTPATASDAAPAAKPAAKKKAKRHSHVDEKSHTTAGQDVAPEEKTDKPTADKDTTKHYHPRDGK